MSHLSLEERAVISSGLVRGETQKAIANSLGRSPSTVSREIARNRELGHGYFFPCANQKAIRRRRQRNVTPKIQQGDLFEKVAEKLVLNWSPQQISGWLAEQDDKLRVSHQTIYDYLWRLPQDHVHRRAMRRRGKRPRKAKPGFITRAAQDRVSIHDRPQVVAKRARTGDWELDLMTCHRASGYLITAVERRTGYLLVSKVASKHSGKVIDGIVKLFGFMDEALLKTFTFDNGTEFYYHAKLNKKLGVKVYFADPYNSGQRGSNENTNGLIRQYFPKTLGYESISHQAVKKVQELINHRPRRRLNFQTPAAVLGKHPRIAFQI